MAISTLIWALLLFCALSLWRRIAGGRFPHNNPLHPVFPRLGNTRRNTQKASCQMFWSQELLQRVPNPLLCACVQGSMSWAAQAAPSPGLAPAGLRAPAVSPHRPRGHCWAPVTPAPVPRPASTRWAEPSPASARARTSHQLSANSRRHWRTAQGEGTSLQQT